MNNILTLNNVNKKYKKLQNTYWQINCIYRIITVDTRKRFKYLIELYKLIIKKN